MTNASRPIFGGRRYLLAESCATIFRDMTALTTGTLSVTRQLRRRAFTEEPAMGLVEALKEIDAPQLVIKCDLKQAVADLKVHIVRWRVVTQVARAGFIFAAMKLSK